MLLNVDKACINKALGFEIPDFIYEEARTHTELKQRLLINLGYEHVKEPYWVIKVTAQYVKQFFNPKCYQKIVEVINENFI